MYLLADNYAAQGMFGFGMLMLIVLLLRRSHRYQRKNKKQQATGTRQKLVEARAATPLLDAPPELLRWQVEMHETARDLKAELDSKMSSLQAIIRMAGEESSRLEAAIARAERLGISPSPDTLVAIENLNSSNGSIGAILPESLLAETDGLTAKRDVVYRLADQGLVPSAIAQSIGAPLGDVELMISLRPESRS